MSADEIRNWEPVNMPRKGMGHGENAIACFLQEIAAQLAELNATLSDPTKGINVGLCATNYTIPVMIRER